MKPVIRVLGLAAIAALTFLVGLARPAEAADGVVKIVGRITGTPRNGPAVASAEAARTLNVGEKASLGLFVNDFDGGVGAGGWPVADWNGEHAWHVRVRPVSVFVDTARLEVEWRRYDKQVGTGAAESDLQVITLRQGQRAVLALARSGSRESQLVNVVVEIEAAYVGDPEYEQSLVGYDLWLVHEHGPEVVKRHAGFVSKPGDKRSFDFEPITFSPLGSDGTPDAARTIQLLLEGELRTRIQPGGTLEIELKANRTLDCGAGTVGRGTGLKSLTVRAGETVAVELPAASGYCTMSRDVKPAEPLPRGLETIDGRVRVNFEEYFRGAKTSILITARRVIVHSTPVREYR